MFSTVHGLKYEIQGIVIHSKNEKLDIVILPVHYYANVSVDAWIC